MSPLGQTIAEILKMGTEDNQCDAKRFLSLLDDLAPELTNERKIFHRIFYQLVFGLVRNSEKEDVLSVLAL